MTAPTVVVLAAGQGTRMRSEVPKVLHELCGRPMGLWPVVAALQAGAGKVVVVDSPARPLAEVLAERGMLAKGECLPGSVERGMLVDSGMLAETVGGECLPASAGVELVVQPRSNGTGGAVVAAAGAIDPAAPVVVLSGDVPLVSAEAIAELVAAHARSGAAATMATTVLEDPSGYGRVVRDERGAVARVVETKKAGDATAAELEIREVNTGIYAFDGDGAAGGAAAAERGQRPGRAVPAAGARPAARRRRGGGGPRRRRPAPRARRQRPRGARAGARARTARDPRAAHARGSDGRGPARHVGRRGRADRPGRPHRAGTALRGATEVGAGATVGPHTTAIDSRIGARAVVRVAWLERAVVHAGASVGPFAYLRPDAVLGEGSKVGTFVEVKNSEIGAGAKIPHLSYIGDADVGERSNLGAGTITANYDGHAKHRTTIGKRVRGGVDTAFVAPGDCRRRRLHRGGLGDHRGRAPRRAGRGARAPAEPRGVRAAARGRAGGAERPR